MNYQLARKSIAPALRRSGTLGPLRRTETSRPPRSGTRPRSRPGQIEGLIIGNSEAVREALRKRRTEKLVERVIKEPVIIKLFAEYLGDENILVKQATADFFIDIAKAGGDISGAVPELTAALSDCSVKRKAATALVIHYIANGYIREAYSLIRSSDELVMAGALSAI
ncbi:MAG: hypothetical protein ABH983_04300 [Candidatus Micrarchaeota archaeon]|nr:hypothetical protein [Candidatus Micrarchaeota archaeon]MBU1682220.1 hypothetical protein [Candidatus Micrarchaeota archaeon]